MTNFDHEKLDVYKVSIDFVVMMDQIIEQFPRGRAYLADQLQRAATSVPLNIAEGAGEYSGAEKNRFYRIAKRSATECAGILDICVRLRLIDEEQYMKGRELLMRIVSILTIPIMIEELEYTENQCFYFDRFEAAHNVL